MEQSSKKIGFLDTDVSFMKMRHFLPLLAVVLVGIYLEAMPGGFGGGFLIVGTLGMALCYIGDLLPIINKYFGGGSCVAIFTAGAIAYWNLLPQNATEVIKVYAGASDGHGFGVAALVCGSILVMDRKILVQGGVRYFIPTIAGVICACGLVAIFGQITGYGWREAILFIGLPIMGGGTAAGALPLSLTYGSTLTQESGYYLSLAMPAVILGNVVSIVFAGLLDSFGKIKPQYSGEGSLLRTGKLEASEKEEDDALGFGQMGAGFLFSMSFFVIGLIISKFVPAVHYYAWTILSVAIFKIAGFCPIAIEKAVVQWYKFFVACFIPATLFSIGFNFLDFGTIISHFSVLYMMYVVITVVGAVIGTWFVGELVGFYPIESAITAGLCMSNMGGSGDIATLGAAKRMNLMAFAQISSRLGGALIIFIASVLAPLIGAGL